MAVPLLLHACCGPCSLEPFRLLREQGFAPTIAYVNPNIQPVQEYDKRLRTLTAWARLDGVDVIEGPCDRDAWERDVAPFANRREQRCRSCYRLRLETAAQMAEQLGFRHLSTTLAVSPYQLSEVCAQELATAATSHGLTHVWQDFRPNYPRATQRSRELGMYRQCYCGCRFSAAEAALGRGEAREDRRRKREIERARSFS